MKIESKTYFLAVYWFILSLFSNVISDGISKYISINFFEITFFRFFFGFVVLIPFIFYHGYIIRQNNMLIHLVRGVLLFLATTSWTYGLSIASMVTATVIGFTIPLLILILSIFFLNENIFWQRWIVVIIGFIGIVITLNPYSNEFDTEVLILVISALLFAALDIINKKIIIKNSILEMLIYSSIIITVLSFIPMLMYWRTPTFFELFLLFILGMNSNIVLFFLLKAFLLADISALAPYRYLELLLSTIISYTIFRELPKENILYGGTIITLSIIFIIYSEKNVIPRLNNKV